MMLSGFLLKLLLSWWLSQDVGLDSVFWLCLAQVVIGAIGRMQRVPRFKSDSSLDLQAVHVMNVRPSC